MTRPVITITGGTGYVGQLLRRGLRDKGYDVQVFDRLAGPVVDLVRRRYLATAKSEKGQVAAVRIHALQKQAEPVLRRIGLIRPTWDDILDVRSALSERFASSHAVIHLAGIAHPYAPGTIDDDFRRVNFDGSVNVFEAARDAGVRRFVFASSAQVYRINDPWRIEQFPILETNPCPTPRDGQTAYGWLKLEMERYLDESTAARPTPTQAVALRLEYPGFRSTSPNNSYVSTSVENLIAGVAGAIEAELDHPFESFNLCDAHVDPEVVDIQQYVHDRWPEVPNYTRGNECLISTEKARTMLGYRPLSSGTYYSEDVVW